MPRPTLAAVAVLLAVLSPAAPAQSGGPRAPVGDPGVGHAVIHR